MSTIQYIYLAIYAVLGLVCLLMAFKSIFSRSFLPFHEEAAGKKLESLEPGMQEAIKALMRVSGAGFLAVGLLLVFVPVMVRDSASLPVKLAAPSIAFIYCAGLFVANYTLYKKTKAATPWAGSLIAMVLLLTGMVLSVS